MRQEEDLGLDDFGVCLCSSRSKAPAADEDKEEDLGMDDLEGLPLLSRSQSASSG